LLSLMVKNNYKVKETLAALTYILYETRVFNLETPCLEHVNNIVNGQMQE